MNKKVIIAIIVAILIICLAIFTGVKLSRNDTKNTNSNPVVPNSETPTNNEIISSPDTETPTPEATETPKASPVPTPTTVLNENVTNYSVSQKEDYAKRVAKEFWEKSGDKKQVYYNVDNVETEGKYIVSVRDKSSTSVLLWYEVDINNKTCKEMN